jgi:hypothetical protein
VVSNRRLEVTVAVIGVVGALFGALIGGLVTYKTTHEQIYEQRATVARDQRASIYRRLLASATIVRTEKDALSIRCHIASEKVFDELYGPTAFSSPHPRFARQISCLFASARRLGAADDRYRRAASDVFVYGSDAAYTAERGLAKVILPKAPIVLGNSPVTTLSRGNEADLSIGTPVEPERFEHAFIAFQRVMCRELSAQPRHGCI